MGSKEVYEMVDWPTHSHAWYKIPTDQQITIFKVEFDLVAAMKCCTRYEKAKKMGSACAGEDSMNIFHSNV